MRQDISARQAIACIAALGVAFLLPVILAALDSVAGSPKCDAVSMFYPLRSFATAELQSGRLPLWNPYVFCGHPFHAEGQGAVFYPVNLVLSLLPPGLAMNIFAVFHFIAAGLFMYLYLKAHGLAQTASLFGALVYMFSSGPVSRLFAGHYTIIPFLALVPAFLWVWEKWRSQPSLVWLTWGAFIYGAMILAGYPQLLLYSSFYFAWHLLFALGQETKAKKGWRILAPAGALLLIVVFGTPLGAVQLFPSYDLAEYSFLQDASYQFCAGFSFPPENALTLLAPGLFGLGFADNLAGTFPYWGRTYFWEMWIYIGIVPLALALLAATRAHGAGKNAHLLALFAFGLLALGGNTPLFRLLYDHVPFFNYFRGTSKFAFFILISLERV